MSSWVPDGQDTPFAWRALQVGMLCWVTQQSWGAGRGQPVHGDTLSWEDKVPEAARGRPLVQGGMGSVLWSPRRMGSVQWIRLENSKV